MPLSTYLIVTDHGILVYLGNKGRLYEVMGFVNGDFLLREIK